MFQTSTRLVILAAALCGAVLLPAVGQPQTIPAFPGADGAAANVIGGRGGLVYHVTKLDQNFNHNARHASLWT